MREMDQGTFWDLISGAKKEHGQDMDASIQWLTNHLTALGPQYAQDFHDILHGYQELANQYGLWSAARLMCENGCSDDGFIDFRAWLIAQGKEVYFAALADPDSLADVEAYGGWQVEELTYVGNEALEAMTGQYAYENTDAAEYGILLEELRQDVVYGTGIQYPYEWDEIAGRFPRLCEKYLAPGTIESMLRSNRTIWLQSSKAIQEAREGGLPKWTPPQTHMKMGGM